MSVEKIEALEQEINELRLDLAVHSTVIHTILSYISQTSGQDVYKLMSDSIGNSIPESSSLMNSPEVVDRIKKYEEKMKEFVRQ